MPLFKLMAHGLHYRQVSNIDIQTIT